MPSVFIIFGFLGFGGERVWSPTVACATDVETGTGLGWFIPAKGRVEPVLTWGVVALVARDGSFTAMI